VRILISTQLEPVKECRELREEQDRLYNESLEADKAKVCTIIDALKVGLCGIDKNHYSLYVYKMIPRY